MSFNQVNSVYQVNSINGNGNSGNWSSSGNVDVTRGFGNVINTNGRFSYGGRLIVNGQVIQPNRPKQTRVDMKEKEYTVDTLESIRGATKVTISKSSEGQPLLCMVRVVGILDEIEPLEGLDFCSLTEYECAEVTILIPDENQDIDIQSMTLDCTISNVTLQHGSITTTTGSISLSDVTMKESLMIKTTNCDMTIHQLTSSSSCIFNTTNGDMIFSSCNLSRDIMITSVNGDVNCTNQVDCQRIKVKTVNGDVETITKKVDGLFELTTVNGNIHCTGKTKPKMVTVNGNTTFTRL